MGSAALRNSRVQGNQVVPPVGAVKPVSFTQTIASAGTVATIYVPFSNKAVRVHGGWVTSSANDAFFIRAAVSANFQLNFRGLANQMNTLNIPVGGVAVSSTNSALVVDVGTAATALTGTIFISED